MAVSYFRSALTAGALVFGTMGSVSAMAAPPEPAGYPALVTLFEQWRGFERPVMNGNVPDYTPAAMTAKAAALPQWQARLNAIKTTGWPIEQQNDYKLVKAE